MKIRITIEYDTDGATLEQEEQDWRNGHVTFEDLNYLHNNGDGVHDITIKFEQLTDD